MTRTADLNPGFIIDSLGNRMSVILPIGGYGVLVVSLFMLNLLF